MKIIVRGEKVTVTSAIDEFINEKLGKLDKYFENPEEMTANVLIKIRKDGHKVEITIPSKKYILRIEEKKDDVYAAIDVAIDKLERQIIKNKSKLEDKNKRGQSFRDEQAYIGELEKFEEDDDQGIVKRKKIELKPMDEEEATIQMELLGHEFYLFKDAQTMEVKLVYKRKEGGYGLIEM